MDISYFREFVTLAQSNSYLEAAEQLFISQSTLSKHIKSFEQELNRPLFQRTTRKVKLTPFGKRFLPYALQIIQIQDAYTEQLLNEQPQETALSIGITTALVEYLLSNVINGFQANFPQYPVHLSDKEIPLLKKGLIDKEFDFIFIHDVVENNSDRYIKEPIEIDNLAAVFPLDHPFASRNSVSLHELRDAQFLFLAEGSVVHDLSLRECRKAGFEPNIRFTSPSCENLFSLVEKHYGISIVAQNHLPPHDHVRLVDIVPHIATAVSVCFREENRSPAAEAFLNWIETWFQTKRET